MKEARIDNAEKTVFSVTGAGKAGQPKLMKVEHPLTIYKSKLKMVY